MPYGAEIFGGIEASQVNTDFYVGALGAGFYQTIASAITAAAGVPSARVIIPYGAAPSDQVSSQSGNANILIVDQRSGLSTTYNWNGSAYVIQLPTTLATTGQVTAAGATFSGPVVLPSGTPSGQQAVSYNYLQSQLQNAGMLPTATAVGQFLVSTAANGNTYGARLIQAGDLPATITSNTSGTAANVTGVVSIANGGSGQTTPAAALAAFGGLALSGGTLTGPLILGTSGAPVAITVYGTSTLQAVSATTLTTTGTITSGGNLTVGSSGTAANLIVYGTAALMAGGSLAGTFTGSPTFSGLVTFSGGANFTAASPLTINGNAPFGLVVTPSSATPNFSGQSGNVFNYTMAQNVTSATLSNLTPGFSYMFKIIQAASGTGPFTFALPAAFLGEPQPVSQNAGQATYYFGMAASATQIMISLTVYV